MWRRRSEPSEMRGWMFWRRPFWTRPAFCIVGALIAVVVIGFSGVDGARSLRNQSLLDDATWCSDHAPPCVDVLHGQLSGPFDGGRQMGTDWNFKIDDSLVDDFTTKIAWNDPLAAERFDATAYLVDGQVVAIETETGYVPVWALGMRGAARAAIVIAVCIGVAIGGVHYGLRKARVYESWWAVSGPPVNPASRWATIFLLPGSLAAMPMIFEVPWWQLWIGVLAIGMCGGLVLLPPWRWPARYRVPGRHRGAERDWT